MMARTPAPDIYDLEPATEFTDTVAQSDSHLAVTEPEAVGVLDGERIAVRLTGTQLSYLGGAQWSDRLSRLAQTRLIESFQNSDAIASVGRPGGAVVNDYGLVIDLRSFHVDVPGSVAHVEMVARLVSDETGRVEATRTFSASQAVARDDRAAMVAALNGAFRSVAADLVTWTLGSV